MAAIKRREDTTMGTYRYFVMQIFRTGEKGLNGGDVDGMRLIGPFKGDREAADWGHTYCAPGGQDDPRWNSVLLDIGPLSLTSAASVYPLAVYAPIMTHVKPGAYPMRDMDKPPIVTDDGLHKDAQRKTLGELEAENPEGFRNRVPRDGFLNDYD